MLCSSVHAARSYAKRLVVHPETNPAPLILVDDEGESHASVVTATGSPQGLCQLGLARRDGRAGWSFARARGKLSFLPRTAWTGCWAYLASERPSNSRASDEGEEPPDGCAPPEGIPRAARITLAFQRQHRSIRAGDGGARRRRVVMMRRRGSVRANQKGVL